MLIFNHFRFTASAAGDGVGAEAAGKAVPLVFSFGYWALDHFWTSNLDTGVQIDLLIDCNDDTINLCEMKYSKSPYPLMADELSKMEYRKTVFKRETGTRKRIMLTIITTFGLTDNGNAADIPVKLTMDDLFQ